MNSAENILMCAPTGAGKTNVAMLTMLHEVRSLSAKLTGSGVLTLPHELPVLHQLQLPLSSFGNTSCTACGVLL